MILLIYGRHVGARPEGHKQGFSLHSFINLGESPLRIINARIWIAQT